MKPNQITGLFRFTALALLISMATALPVRAQTNISLRSPQPRVTVPLNSISSILISNQLSLHSNTVTTAFVTNVDFNVSGVSSIPGGGVSAVLSTNSRSDGGPVFITLNAANVTQGTYTFSLNASGKDTTGTVSTNNLLFILQAGYIWNGTNNAVLGGAGNWSDATKWLGGAAPGAGDEVIFNDLGGQTNSVVSTATTTNLLPNSVVNNDTTIGSLRFAQTNSSTAFQTVQIGAGKKLMITGINGFSVLRDYIDEIAGIGAGLTVTIAGTNGAALIVSNKNANFAVLVDSIVSHTLDMSRLDNFAATVNVMGMGDQYIYPNFWNFQQNNYGGIPRRVVPFVNMARTNVVTAYFADGNNYTNPLFRPYAIQFVGTLFGNGSVGASPLPVWNLGITNMFFADSVLVAGANQRATLQFNPLFATNYPCFAVFRNTNGGRMSTFAQADAQGTNGSQGNIKSDLNFGPNGGSVDILVDRFYIGRDRPLINVQQTPNYQGFFTMGKGIIDANTAYLGFREFGEYDYTNYFVKTYGWNTNYAWNGYCEGRLTVSNSAIFKVNDTLTLGYTAETNASGLGTLGNQDWGQLIINNGGTVMANRILVGGGLGFTSDDNSIALDHGNLIVSNTLGNATTTVNLLSMINASTLTLHLNGTNTGFYVYATNLTMSGGQNALTIGSVANLVIPPSGTNVPIFSFVTGGADFPIVTMPSPMRGTIVPNGAFQADLNIITNAPKNLVWRGTANSIWNVTSKNWFDTATGLITNYVNGDAVLFDDFGGVPTTISLATALVPDSIVVSNSANSFIFSDGGGDILGGSLTKNGTGTLQIGSGVSAALSVALNQGLLTGAGTVSSVNVAAGATLDYSGTISPSGVTCAGTAIFESGSTIAGTLAIQTGGIVTNANGASTVGPIATQSGALLYNEGHLGNSGIGIGSSTIVSNATFINAGNIGLVGGNSTLTVNGLFKEMGVVGKNIYLTTLTIGGSTLTNNGGAGTFIPGGDGIGVTTIKSPNIVGITFSGRVSMGVGSTNIFKVDLSVTPSNTVLQAPWIDYGPSIGNPGFEGGFIWVTNVGGPALAAGQSFGMFKYVDGTTPIQFGSTNSYPLMLPTVPGPGLAWDLNNVKLGGIVAIRSVGTTPTNITVLSSSFGLVTNLTSTNRGILMNLQWPSNYTGWHVEEQSGNRNGGYNPTNWGPIFESYFTNRITVTNVVGSNNIGFYRMVFP